MLKQGKHVEGNQEGAANVKKMRTWRQYMNRWVGELLPCVMFINQNYSST